MAGGWALPAPSTLRASVVNSLELTTELHSLEYMRLRDLVEFILRQHASFRVHMPTSCRLCYVRTAW